MHARATKGRRESLRRHFLELHQLLDGNLPGDLSDLVAQYTFKAPSLFASIPTVAGWSDADTCPDCYYRRECHFALTKLSPEAENALASGNLELMASSASSWWPRCSCNTQLVRLQLQSGRVAAAAFCMRQAPMHWHRVVKSILFSRDPEKCPGFRHRTLVLYVSCFPAHWRNARDYLAELVMAWRWAECRDFLEAVACPPDDILYEDRGVLLLSLRQFDVKMLRTWLAAGLSVNWTMDEGRTLLRVFLFFGIVSCAHLLLTLGARADSAALLEAICLPFPNDAKGTWLQLVPPERAREFVNGALPPQADIRCAFLLGETRSTTVVDWVVENWRVLGSSTLDDLLAYADQANARVLKSHILDTQLQHSVGLRL